MFSPSVRVSFARRRRRAALLAHGGSGAVPPSASVDGEGEGEGVCMDWDEEGEGGPGGVEPRQKLSVMLEVGESGSGVGGALPGLNGEKACLCAPGDCRCRRRSGRSGAARVSVEGAGRRRRERLVVGRRPGRASFEGGRGGAAAVDVETEVEVETAAAMTCGVSPSSACSLRVDRTRRARSVLDRALFVRGGEDIIAGCGTTSGALLRDGLH
ncbi:hypothetical protein B0H15DRAFT_852332 [Mycena belliarum]|uniref:Uncharacterized protein n=1 Tax=Mycena belliarum TaxID=1033014 RepID=A0AAD6XRK1_9AGAR|nr:hypothetical protein B0H15DRAFT_852332 [Mycena belliae]